MNEKIIKNKINGVLLFNKPINLSSNQALQKVKHLFCAQKAGHTGTLDPMATGLLPICFGEATKFSSFLLDSNKEYIASIKLGVETDTYDSEGKIIAEKAVICSITEVEKELKYFTGLITQTPPIYSALKLNGKPLYSYARDGIAVDIKSRQVEVYQIEVLDFKDHILTLRILCSKGTYIRSIAHDLGQKLGCGASLSGLIRTKTNDFKLDPRLNLEYLSSIAYEEKLALLLPIEVLVAYLPTIYLTDYEFNSVKNGHKFMRDDLDHNLKYSLFYQNKFLGIAKLDPPNIIQPVRLMNMHSQ